MNRDRRRQYKRTPLKKADFKKSKAIYTSSSEWLWLNLKNAPNTLIGFYPKTLISKNRYLTLRKNSPPKAIYTPSLMGIWLGFLKRPSP